MSLENLTGRVPSIRRPRTGVVFGLIAAVLSLLLKGVRGFIGLQAKSRGSPPPVPDALRRDVGLPPIERSRTYRDYL